MIQCAGKKTVLSKKGETNHIQQKEWQQYHPHNPHLSEMVEQRKQVEVQHTNFPLPVTKESADVFRTLWSMNRLDLN